MLFSIRRISADGRGGSPGRTSRARLKTYSRRTLRMSLSGKRITHLILANPLKGAPAYIGAQLLFHSRFGKHLWKTFTFCLLLALLGPVSATPVAETGHPVLFSGCYSGACLRHPRGRDKVPYSVLWLLFWGLSPPPPWRRQGTGLSPPPAWLNILILSGVH